MNLSFLGALVPKFLAISMAGLVLGTGATQIVEVSQEAPVVKENLTAQEVTVEEQTEPEPEMPVEAPQKPSEAVQEQKPATVPSTPLQPATKQITDINEFERTYLWTCPKDVPAGVWPDPLKPNVALGILSSDITADYNNQRGRTLFGWLQFKEGRSASTPLSLGSIEDIGIHVPKNCGAYYCHGSYVGASGWVFYMDWNKKLVYLGTYETGAVEISEKTRSDAEAMAEWMTGYLRTIEDSYISRCGA